MNYLFASVFAVIGGGNIKLAQDYHSSLALWLGIVAFICCMIFARRGDVQSEKALKEYSE